MKLIEILNVIDSNWKYKPIRIMTKSGKSLFVGKVIHIDDKEIKIGSSINADEGFDLMLDEVYNTPNKYSTIDEQDMDAIKAMLKETLSKLTLPVLSISTEGDVSPQYNSTGLTRLIINEYVLSFI